MNRKLVLETEIVFDPLKGVHLITKYYDDGLVVELYVRKSLGVGVSSSLLLMSHSGDAFREAGKANVEKVAREKRDLA